MQYGKTAKDVFEAWGKDYHADGMETEHWPRVRRIFDLIQPSNGYYLEVGVGNGYGLAHMATHQFAQGHCMGLDFSSTMAERAQRRTAELANVVVANGDFLAWDFGGTKFDAIFSMEVFYYFANIQQGLERSFSILAPRGQLWVAVNYYEENEGSTDWPERLQAPMQRWSAQDYVAGFRSAGFAAVEQRLIDTPLPAESEHANAPTLCTWGMRP